MRLDFVALCGALVCSGMLSYAQTPAPYDMAAARESGQGITGALEGWFQNPDGSFSILLGYFNRNTREELDIPVGPDNRMEPSDPDRGQPVHFLTGREWGVFTVTVPRDFGSNKINWTLTANGQTNVIPLSLNPLWEVSPFREEGIGNTPPFLGFEKGGPSVQGPRPLVTSMSATVSDPLPLTVWVSDDAKTAAGAQPQRGSPVTIAWSQFRGPGKVAFANPRPSVTQDDSNPTAVFSGHASSAATFPEPGEYVLHVVANDWSGDGGRGFQCCWTNGEVKVTVKPAPGH